MKNNELEVENELKFNLNSNVKYLLLLYDFNVNESFTFSDIEKYFKFVNPQPKIRQLLKLLLDNNIIYTHNRIGRFYSYKLNIKKLSNFIENTEAYNNIYNYIKTRGIIFKV